MLSQEDGITLRLCTDHSGMLLCVKMSHRVYRGELAAQHADASVNACIDAQMEILLTVILSDSRKGMFCEEFGNILLFM